MALSKEQISSKLDIIILTLILMQVVTVSISIAISSICFGAWLILWMLQLSFFRKETSREKIWNELKYIALFMALYSIAEIASRVFAVFPDDALTGAKRLLIFFIFFAMVYKVPDRKSLYFLLFVVLCFNSFVSIYELIQYAILAPEQIPQKGFSETRIDYLLYPLSAAEIKVMVLMTILPLFFIKERFFVRKRYLIALSLPVVITLILTQSRNVYLAVMVCLIIFGIIKNWKVLLIGTSVVVIMFFILPSDFTSRITSMFDPEHMSNAARITMWETGWKIFLSNPIIGAGDNKIMDVYAMYKYPLTDWEHSHLHSNIFMILATTGILGFISFAGIFLSIFLKQLKFYKEIKNESDNALILGSILMFIAFHISGIFEWSFGDHEVITVFFFLISVPFIIFKLTPKKIDTN